MSSCFSAFSVAMKFKLEEYVQIGHIMKSFAMSCFLREPRVLVVPSATPLGAGPGGPGTFQFSNLQRGLPPFETSGLYLSLVCAVSLSRKMPAAGKHCGLKYMALSVAHQ